MNKLSITGVEAFEDNYIWLIHGNKRNNVNKDIDKRIIIVDPGDKDAIMDAIKANDYKPQAIFITHHHGDHVGAVKKLVEQYEIPVYGPANENIPCLSHPLTEDDSIDFEEMDLSFNVLDVPGHTKGHIAYYGHQSLFIGDTLFAGGCGRLFEGTPAQMQHSLAKLLELDDDTLVYCAHEYTQANLGFAIRVEPENPALIARIEETNRLRADNQPTVPSLLSLEKQTNPFLRFYENTVIKAAEGFAGQSLPDPVAVFKTVRYWKDTLD